MNFDIVSSIVSTFTLARILHGCASAGNDTDHFVDMVSDTSKLHSDVSLDFEKFSVFLSSKRKKRLASDIKRAGVVLENAKTAMGVTVGKVPRKRSRVLAWVFKSKEAAQLYQPAVLHWHNTLRDIEKELEGRRPSYGYSRTSEPATFSSSLSLAWEGLDDPQGLFLFFFFGPRTVQV
jgi:hypothetical protein